MKLFLPFVLLCLLVVVSCKKADQQSKDKSQAWSEKKSHNVKKYNQENAHHHDKHQMVHHHEHSAKHESHPTERKKAEAHHGYHNIPKHEAELQKDIKSSKKEIDDRLAKEEQDLHLQDLTHPDDPANADHKNHKSPHQYQRGHHKANKHFSPSKEQKTPHHQVEDEKLFAFSEPKQPEPKQSHPVLEDSFEAISEDVVQEQSEHSQTKKKDSTKNKKPHKKAYEKSKEKTKNKENEKIKSKEDKKNKKQYNKGKKEKKQW